MEGSTLQLTVNGHRRELSVETPQISEVLKHLDVRPDRIALEVNGEVVPRSSWSETIVQSGDRLEIVHFVGGGSYLLD
ncbi:sulfur carrier protein ThiS [Granulicella cerasi]|uniref:Sulfur carrier protein ThiS n=1 Tax=Granulicella cerasi TaxID=741063 RepID=A0ABW1Z512_9BACT|nr:sulfur carrier protein ThiS [Granulicella cerasi]